MSSFANNLKPAVFAALCLTAAVPSLAQTLRICGDSTAANYATNATSGLQG